MLGTAGEGWTHKQHSSIDSYPYTPVIADQQKHIHQLCADTGCHLENLSSAMADRDGRRERFQEIQTVSTT